MHSPNVYCFCVKSSVNAILTVIKQNTAKHFALSVKVKMALTEDLTQEQHTFDLSNEIFQMKTTRLPLKFRLV